MAAPDTGDNFSIGACFTWNQAFLLFGSVINARFSSGTPYYGVEGRQGR
jgi:hypothetical protein